MMIMTLCLFVHNVGQYRLKESLKAQYGIIHENRAVGHW